MKVGDYVRTENGHIDKIVKISDEMKSGRTIKVQIGEIDNICGYDDFVDWFSPSHFIKSSPSIIDLIEVGDYVNGERIQFITNKKELLTDGGYDLLKKYVDIKSILTKEQFESMEYKVGE